MNMHFTVCKIILYFIRYVVSTCCKYCYFRLPIFTPQIKTKFSVNTYLMILFSLLLILKPKRIA